MLYQKFRIQGVDAGAVCNSGKRTRDSSPIQSEQEKNSGKKPKMGEKIKSSRTREGKRRINDVGKRNSGKKSRDLTPENQEVVKFYSPVYEDISD